jgi:2-polyprenyl-3-methyl-5-hydroxy-6-metoxy-1,4-benzoquinol methylase
MTSAMKTQLQQRGRAELAFVAELGLVGAHLKRAVRKDIEARGLKPEALPRDLDERDAQIETALRDSRAFQNYRMLHGWGLNNLTRAAFDAFEANRAVLEPQLNQPPSGPATLTVPEHVEIPTYWHNWFHNTTGGWDGHPYMGFIHGELIHRWVVGATFPGNIFKQREDAASEAPRKRYRRILDMGCGTGHYTRALTSKFPDAEIWGSDCSIRELEYALRVANDNGWAWRLHRVPNENTGLPAAHFDLVTSYILLHELPVDAIRATFREAFRLLEPGGDMLMADVTRFSEMDPVAVWQQDWAARREVEPFWRESATLDLRQAAQEAGFVDVASYGLGAMKYPWIVRGRKPG